MNQALPEHFLLMPGDTNGKLILFELQSAGYQNKNSVVLIPYINPQQNKIAPVFFNIKNKTEFTPQPKQTAETSQKIKLKSCINKADYITKVKALKKHIEEGNIYEINYCVSFSVENVTIDPLNVFLKLHELAKAPYARLLKNRQQYIISASPELFLKKEGNILSTKPIKGTIRRGNTPEEDNKLKEKLFTDLKERTENVMAVDVARNDLSIVASKGSVKVNKLYNIESFETVHQMVSTVSCELKQNISLKEIIDATFPMASMTGAPKKSAMNLIDEFEDFKRVSYSGALGIIDKAGDFEMSVVIRSIFYNSDTKNLSIAVGSAITYLSDPEQEYAECLLKAKAMLKALNAEIL